MGLRISDFNYYLPRELIAQEPSKERDKDLMMVLYRKDRRIEHRRVKDIVEYLKEKDVIVLNNSRVIPVKFFGRRKDTNGKVEILFVERITEERYNTVNHKYESQWYAFCRSRISNLEGKEVVLPGDGEVTVTGRKAEFYILSIKSPVMFEQQIKKYGLMPLPPYIKRNISDPRWNIDKDRYQTVYASVDGSIAAPTAGLHFSEELLEKVRSICNVVTITLHVGPGTFLPVKSKTVEDHIMYKETFYISDEVAEVIKQTKKNGGRVIAVGTTTVRALESMIYYTGGIRGISGYTELFIKPPFDFKIVDVLLTNFHLPCSTLLLLVSAFAAPRLLYEGKDIILEAYQEAINKRYRFYSYGDCMLII